MDDVTNQDTVEPKVEETTAPVSTDEIKTPEGTVEGQPEAVPSESNVELENLKKALRSERDSRKRYQRELAGFRGQPEVPEGETDENIYQHPEVQKLLLRNAEFELKEGVKDILNQYNLPKEVKAAIQRNPRGFVSPETTDVQNALLDIQDYVESLMGELESGSLPAQPKDVPIAGNNPVATGTNEAGVQELLNKPPEEFTPEDDKKLADYLKLERKKKGVI